MASHFSIGFVIESSPKRPIVSVCARATDRVEVDATWPRYSGDYCMCGSKFCRCADDCIKPGVICGPKGDDVYVIFSVYDTDCDEFDVYGASEIVFAVADRKGGTVRFVKRLTEGDIQISTNRYQFMVTITDEDTAALVNQSNYYEVQITTSDGLKKTVSSGIFRATDTIIKDIP